MNYSLYVESTPNPEVMKFVSNKILSKRNIEVKSLEEAMQIPIAKELLKFPFVKSIFFSGNFISITKVDNILWEDIAMQLRVFILDFLNSKQKEAGILADETSQESASSNKEVLKEIKEFHGEEKLINDIINEYIKPAVESDGGSITLNNFKDGIVEVNLSGACSGCPSSKLTLKQGIEHLLKEKMGDTIKEVVAKDL